MTTKAKRGRPEMSPHLGKFKTLSIRMTLDEHDLCAKAAHKAGTTISGHFRPAILALAAQNTRGISK